MLTIFHLLLCYWGAKYSREDGVGGESYPIDLISAFTLCAVHILLCWQKPKLTWSINQRSGAVSVLCPGCLNNLYEYIKSSERGNDTYRCLNCSRKIVMFYFLFNWCGETTFFFWSTKISPSLCCECWWVVTVNEMQHAANSKTFNGNL